MKKPTQKTVAIRQSNYIRWKGYFDMINMVDEFVFFDDAQFTKKDWRNRNLIKTPHGLLWLTIPVRTSGLFHQAIADVRVAGDEWKSKHLKSILSSYGRASCFAQEQEFIRELYQRAPSGLLSEINHSFIRRS